MSTSDGSEELAKLVQGPGPESHSEKNASRRGRSCWGYCCRCCRCLAGVLLFPVVLLLSILGGIVWLLLCPLRCCSPCVSPLIDLVVQLLTLPLKLFRWIAGATEEDEKDDAPSKGDPEK